MSLISIIMPYYKKEMFVKKSVKSLLNQTYQNFEIILVNDQADERSSIFLKDILNLDNRIKLVTNEKNLGVGESRNKAIEIAKGIAKEITIAPVKPVNKSVKSGLSELCNFLVTIK